MTHCSTSAVSGNTITRIPNCFTPRQMGLVSLGTALIDIQRGKYADGVQYVREVLANHDESPEGIAEVRRRKSMLPCYVFTGVFEGRVNNQNFKRSSGVFLADLDHIGNVEAVKALLVRELDCLMFAFVSPSGDGLKIGLRVPVWSIGDDSGHKRVFTQVRDLFADRDLKIDKSCNNVGRLCFASWDPLAYVNWDCVELAVNTEGLSFIDAKPNGRDHTPDVARDDHPVLTVVEVVKDHGGGKLDIVCPWASDHTDGGNTATIWTKAGVDGTFDCFHDHCRGRGWRDLIGWCESQPGYVDASREAFAMVAVDIEQRISMLHPTSDMAEVESIMMAFLHDPAMMVEYYLQEIEDRMRRGIMAVRKNFKELKARAKRAAKVAKGADVTFVDFDPLREDQALATVANMRALLTAKGLDIRWNSMAREYEIKNFRSESKFREERAALVLTDVEDMMKLAGVYHGEADKLLVAVAHDRIYHPFVEWLGDTKWDGRSRLAEVLGSLKEPGDMTEKEKWISRVMFTKWMKSVVSCAYTYAQGHSPRGVLMLCGPQMIGKTSFFSYLVPDEMRKLGASLDANNKDQAIRVNKYLIVELAEIDGGLSKVNMAALKAFLSNDQTHERGAYRAKDSQYDRRTVFGGSTNQMDYINDFSGTRFWTIRVDDINSGVLGAMYRSDHQCELKQLWAEVRELYNQDSETHLVGDEITALNDRNQGHLVTTDADDYLESIYNFQTECKTPENMSEICRTLNGYGGRISRKAVKDALVRKGVPAPTRPTWENGSMGRWYFMPSKLDGSFL